MMLSKACDFTGVVCIACARHGCYAPNSLVNLSSGEQQKNVDFAFLAALRTTNTKDIERVLLLYDIACQYSVHLLERIEDDLPEGIEIDCGIGMFHVHGHQEECFYRFAPSFIPGAGNVAGEILETLWSELNQISSSTRTMTLASRAETLEDHTSDSNFKKTIGMRESTTAQCITHYLPFNTAVAVCQTYLKALEKNISANEYYNDMSAGLDKNSVAEWDAEIEDAERHRREKPSVMDIMKARHHTSDPTAPPAYPTTSGVDKSRLSTWFEIALQIEDKQ
jgi:hypothetical protein